jgi:hypothetical protein
MRGMVTIWGPYYYALLRRILNLLCIDNNIMNNILLIFSQIHALKSIVASTRRARSKAPRHFVSVLRDGPIIQRRFPQGVSVSYNRNRLIRFLYKFVVILLLQILMNATRALDHLESVEATQFAQIPQDVILVLANPVIPVTPMSTVMTSTSVHRIEAHVVVRLHAKIFPAPSNAHVTMERPSIPSPAGAEVQSPAQTVTSVPATPFAQEVPAIVPRPTLDPIAKTPVTRQPVSQIHNVSSKMQFPCVDAYPDFSFFPSSEPVSILTNARPLNRPVAKEPFVKMQSEHSDANVRPEQPETQHVAVSALLPKSADQTPSAIREKRASLPRENVCADEAIIETPRLENAGISMSA